MKRGQRGHLHSECTGTVSDTCRPHQGKPHVHYDTSGFCSHGDGHVHCKGVFDAGLGKTLNCPCDCHGAMARAGRHLRTMADAMGDMTLLARMRWR